MEDQNEGFKKPDFIKPIRKSQGPEIQKLPEDPTTAENDGASKANVNEIKREPEPPAKKPFNSAERKAKYAAILAQLKYTVPSRAAPFNSKYSLEVLKNGSIIERVEFTPDKTFYVIGRSPGCDIVGEHLTFSRLHAIIQYIGENKESAIKVDTEGDEAEVKPEIDPNELGMGDCKEKGLYIYDLGSTHGSFLNKNQLYPKKYYRLRVGHVLKFGGSSRLFVVTGPPEDEEEESEKTVTELLKERLEKDFERKRQMEEQKFNPNPIPLETNVEEEGVSWGMPEDAVEESDLSINPFAADFETTDTNFDNPKKTLLGWFEREGYHDELVYDVREKAAGHFICRINLPLNGPAGAPVFAEVDGKGKKKEIVVQCALKACQLLDKYGVLRQSHREGFKRKMKDWEEKDYYSSDEDTFLDRTGSVEKKRKVRMTRAGKIETKTETYESLTEKHDSIQSEIDKLTIKLRKAESDKLKEDSEADPLDAFMQHLKTGAGDIGKIKLKLKELTEELKQAKKLMDIAAPFALPSAQPISKTPSTSVKVESNISRLKPSPTIINSENVGKSEEAGQSETSPIPPSPKKTKLIEQSPAVETENEGKSVDEEEDDGVCDSTTPNIPSDRRKAMKEDVGDNETVESVNANANEGDEFEEENVVESSESKKRKRSRFRHQKKPTASTAQDYDSNKPEYSDWVPPTDQRGDGWTTLNEKLGY